MQRSHWLSLALLAALACGLPAAADAGQPFRYPEKQHGKGELRYVNHVPVLFVEGTPEEIGEQIAELGAKPGGRLLRYPRDILKEFWADVTWPVFVTTGKRMVNNFPPDHRREMDAMVKAGIDPELLTAANTMFDVFKVIACSTLIVESERSATRAPIFGRNLDFPTAGYLQDYSVVMVYRPEGKHAFVSIGFPGLVGCLSGMNDSGLSLAVLEVLEASDGSKKFDVNGTPYAMNYRRILEECTTVEEAEKLLRTMKRTTRNNLAICDRNGGAVFEITPTNVVVRRAVGGLCPCTNHFCSPQLAPRNVENRVYTKDRYEVLVTETTPLARVDVPDVARLLHQVNGGDYTLQTMIFEPTKMRLHLAIGSCPASALPLRTLDVAALLRPSRNKTE